MIRDVFYYGKKPNIHPREKFAESLDDARNKCTTDHFWIINEFCDYKNFEWNFDFEFLSDSEVWAIDHNNVWPSQHQKDSGTWLCSKKESNIIVYRNDVEPIIRKNIKNEFWVLHDLVDETKFDFSWHPDPTDPKYIYVWGNKYIDGSLLPTLEYYVPNATEKKYMTNDVEVLPEWNKWKIIQEVDKDKFDFSWRPDPREPAYIYQFGTQWQKTGGPRYIVEGATEVKYIDNPIAKAAPNRQHWIIPDDIAVEEFDFSWHPDSTEEPYIYQFGTQWQKTGGPKFYAVGADKNSEVKYIDILKAKALPNKNNWEILIPIDDFDFSWHPDSTEEPYIYVFGNTHFPAEKMPTIQYTVLGATKIKYVHDIVAKLTPNKKYWNVIIPINEKDFDLTWIPDPNTPPYIYVWGNQWNRAEIEPTIEYSVPGATERHYISDSIAKIKDDPNNPCWEIIIPVFKFDFSWRPNPKEPPYIYVFGNENNDAETEPTIIYRVPGATEYKFINEIIANINKPIEIEDKKDEIKQIVKNVERSIFFIDKNNKENDERFKFLQQKFPNIVKKRYLNSWIETIKRCCSQSETELFWVVNSELDYSSFSFDYNPNPWQMKMLHVFGTQWGQWGNTYLINKNKFLEDSKYINIIEHLSSINFVRNKKALATNCLYDVYLIDHGNDLTNVITTIENKTNRKIEVINYETSYLNTIKNLFDNLGIKKDHYIWICSSICDYTNFDFSYIVDPFAREDFHVFRSGNQVFGDTFFINVNNFRNIIDDLVNLTDFNKLNFNKILKAERLPNPVITIYDDTHVNFNQYDYNFPYATFVTIDNKNLGISEDDDLCLWTEETKNITITSSGGSRLIIPKEAKKYVKKELYDYPYIKTSKNLLKSNPLDIIFLSNGESIADSNYEHLLSVTKNLPNRVVRVDGINGRVNAYHAAANASNTSWFFTVFAKLCIDKDFDFSWQPDRLQNPKHYIFKAVNPVNELNYGHQAMIAYNKNLTLNNYGIGLDFTLDDEHEVLNINSGTALYNTDPFSTWRTAFREAVKLKFDNTHESNFRLEIWQTKGIGDYAEYSIKGANDAVKYYEEVEGNIDQLKLSYEWAWLKSRFKY